MIGRGYSAAQKLLSILNLSSPVNKAPWAAHTKAIEDTACTILDQELASAALEVKRLKLANGDITAVDDNATDDQLREVVAEAGVSTDGSWSSRGWSARDGVVAVISIDTGKFLDVVHLSNQCNGCSQKERPLPISSSLMNFFCAAFYNSIGEILDGNRAAITHSTFFPRAANRHQ